MKLKLTLSILASIVVSYLVFGLSTLNFNISHWTDRQFIIWFASIVIINIVLIKEKKQ